MEPLYSRSLTTPSSSSTAKPRGILPPHIHEAMKKDEKTKEIADKNLKLDQELRTQRNEACKKDKF